MRKINRIFDYSQEVLKEAVKNIIKAQKDSAMFNKDEMKAFSEEMVDGAIVSSGEPKILEVARRIEDFAEILLNDGFDVENQMQLSVDELSNRIIDFVKEGATSKIINDFGINTLGFVVQQTVTRLVSKMDSPDLQAWMLVSKEIIMDEGSVLYNVIIGTEGHGTSRIAEGGEYNTFRLESTEDYIKTSGGKVGIMASYSKEALKRAGLQAIKLLAEAALNDMKRFKSLEAIHILEANGKDYYDGLDPLKMPSGRSYEQLDKANGTILMRDLEKFFGDTQSMGYEVDVIFLNPLSYAMFLNEPYVRDYIKENAGVYFLVPKKRNTIFHNKFTKMTKITSNTDKVKEGSEVILPNLIGNKAFNIIVTPIVKFHKKGEAIFEPKTRYTANPIIKHQTAPNNCGDVLLIDSSRALTYVHDGSGISSDTIENNLRDVTYLKFNEYYNFILEKDHGVFAFRNINITDDVFDPKQKLTVTVPHSAIFPPKA